MIQIIWSDYFQYRTELRGFGLEEIERILRYSPKRYYDRETGREVAVGKHDDRLVIITMLPLALVIKPRNLEQMRGHTTISQSYASKNRGLTPYHSPFPMTLKEM